MAAAMVWAPILEEGVFRFDASEAARAAAGPSLSFAKPRRREVVLHEGAGDAGRPAVVLECEVVGDGVHGVQIKIFTWNTDAWGYGSGTTSLYQSHPWVLSILPDGKGLGVLADTTRRCEELCPCLQNGPLAIINVALATSLPRESLRYLVKEM